MNSFYSRPPNKVLLQRLLSSDDRSMIIDIDTLMQLIMKTSLISPENGAINSNKHEENL